VPESALTPDVARREQVPSRPVLSVVVPVYNQPRIAENLRVIRARVEKGLGTPIELILVLDGSEQAEGGLPDDTNLARVIHYDRNLGKGYAVKAGALAAQGEWIAFVDADLDLDPSALPEYLEVARDEGLDVVIGSKRHPGSTVEYPRSRRWGSWLYQKLVRVLFRLDVRDTQVGLKLFRRELSDEVVPLLLVKQYAFDLEFLAVARALGFDRIREMPVTLLYRSTGSGVRPVAVMLALLDTIAIFYRLRVLRYYQRKQELLTGYGRGGDHRPPVALVTPQPDLVARQFDYPGLELVQAETGVVESRRRAAQASSQDILAFLESGAVPAGNWLDSTIPFFANHEIAAPRESELRLRLRNPGSAAGRTTSASHQGTSALCVSSPPATS
jgi:glycosyltransferase involved in cell wall biosynthesis